MGLQRFPYSDYRGGVNLLDGPLNLEANEAQGALNVSITQRGALFQRAGKVAFTTTGYPTGKRIESMRNWYFGVSRVLMCSIDGDIYSMSTGAAFTQRFDGTAGKHWSFEGSQDGSGNNRVWAMNGVDAPQKWDGAAGSSSAWANSPPNGTMLRLWKNRMCIAGVSANPTRLFFSDIGNPESPAATYGTNWVDIKSTEDDEDPITWLDTVGDVLIVFKKRSVWAVYDPTTFQNQRLGSPGCEGRFQSTELGGRLYYICRDGIYSVTPNAAPELESLSITPFFTDTVDSSRWDQCRIAASRDRRLFAAFPIGQSYNQRLWEGIPEMRQRRDDGSVRMPWLPHDYTVSSLATFRTGSQDLLVAGDSNAAKIHQLFTGTNDDGVAIDSFYFGAWRGLLTEEPIERLRRVNVEMEGRFFIDLYQDLNADAPKWSKLFEIIGDSDPLWAGGIWDDGGTWDPANVRGFRRGRPEKRGRYHALKIRNNMLNRTWKLFTTELALRGGKEHTK